MTDQNRKTLRSFYCRDYLWELFEQMAQELGCSMDYLINESMRHYARNRDYAVGDNNAGAPGGGYGANGHQPPQPPGAGGYGGGGGQPQQQPVNRLQVGGGYQEHRTFERMPAVGGQSPATRPQQPGTGGFSGQQARPPQPPGASGAAPPPPPRPGGGWGGNNNNNNNSSVPPSPPQPGNNAAFGGGFSGGSATAGRPPLYMFFNNNRYQVDKEKFVIGRGSQNTDLTIRDGNISRKHCAVIFRNGQYYIKDMGSTNGVEYRGNRIESKKIEEGDVFYLCDYELRFSYRG